jgi:hypothetical protein
MYHSVLFKNMDWPEAIFDAWLSFEHMHGSVEDIQDCIERIEKAQRAVYTKRMKVCLSTDAISGDDKLIPVHRLRKWLHNTKRQSPMSS